MIRPSYPLSHLSILNPMQILKSDIPLPRFSVGKKVLVGTALAVSHALVAAMAERVAAHLAVNMVAAVYFVNTLPALVAAYPTHSEREILKLGIYCAWPEVPLRL